MDGAKSATDTTGDCTTVAVDRRSVRAKACPRGHVNLSEMKILVGVGTEYCENQYHRKG